MDFLHCSAQLIFLFNEKCTNIFKRATVNGGNVVKKLKYNEKRAELYYVNNFFVENRKWKLKILYLPFWLCARKINIAFASKKGIKITKFVLNYL